jgi:SSS family solute:Na+ symporter
MTVAEYLERRYSRGTRTLGAAISWVAGMINFGFFPLISSKFLMALIGLPAHFEFAGMHVATYPVVTAVTVLLPLMFVMFGGHLTVLVSDFTQGLFMNIAALALVFTVLSTAFHWDQIVFSLKAAGQPNASLLNPLNTSETKDFNAWYYLLAVVTAYYSVMSNIAAQGFQGSARNAHELRMGFLLNQIRWQGLLVFFMAFVLVVMTYMHHPAYAATAEAINRTLDAATGSHNVAAPERTQMLVPAALSYILPHGMIGLFCSIMVAALISSCNAFMHAWGSVFLQDIVLPFRKKPLSTRHHIWALRLSVMGVALIAFLLSLTIVPKQSILMYFALFNNLWLGPAGAVILGGLYWKRGTTRAAITTLIVGVLVSASLILLSQCWGKFRPTYTAAAFSDPAGVVAQVKGETRPIDQFVWEHIPAQDQTELSQPEAASPRTREILARAFNSIAKPEPLYNESRFAGISVSRETLASFGHRAPAFENRQLLSLAYPSVAAEETFPINEHWS